MAIYEVKTKSKTVTVEADDYEYKIVPNTVKGNSYTKLVLSFKERNDTVLEVPYAELSYFVRKSEE